MNWIKNSKARGHLFCRYADDCNIYMSKAEKQANELWKDKSLIEKRLKLKVNKEKSAVGVPTSGSFWDLALQGKRRRSKNPGT